LLKTIESIEFFNGCLEVWRKLYLFIEWATALYIWEDLKYIAVLT